MCRNALTVLILFLILCPSIVAFGIDINTDQSHIQREKNHWSGSVDVPTWYQGDEWTYTIDPLYYSSTNGSFSGSMQNFRQQVIGIVGDAYQIALAGEISGELTVSGISGDLTGEITGTSYMRISDLAEQTSEVHSEGSIVVIVPIPYELDLVTSSSPALELFDYPVAVGEEWQLSGRSTTEGAFNILGLYEQSLNGNQTIDEVVSCPAEESISVPAGIFDCFSVSHGNTIGWYSSSVGNIVKSIIDQSDENTTVQMTQTLASFSRVDQPLTISEELIPSVVFPGEMVRISGLVVNTESGYPVQNGAITIAIPSTSQTWSTTTGTDGIYSFSFSAPTMLDDTPSGRETGSGGVIVSCSSGGLSGYRVASLVTWQNTAPSAPSIEGELNGNVGTSYEYTVSAIDPETDNVSYNIDWGDATSSGWIGPFHSGSPQKVSHSFSQKGTFTITVTAKDVYGAEGPEGTLQVTMPTKSIWSFHPLLQYLESLLGRFPHLFPLVRYFLGI